MVFKSTVHEFKTKEECVEYGKLHESKMDYYFKGMVGVVPESPAGVAFECVPKDEEPKKPDVKA